MRQLFRHYPTLHEAPIRELEVRASEQTAFMVVDYADTDDGGRTPLTARIRLEWTGLKSIELPLSETELFGLSFAQRDGLVETRLELSAGVFGVVVSEGFEAVLMQMDASREDDLPNLRLHW